MTAEPEMQVAVVCEPGSPDAAAIQTDLQAASVADVAWFAPRDADDLDEQVRAGRVQRVIFARADDFLTALWDRQIDAAAWTEGRVTISFANNPDAPTDLTPAAAKAVAVAWRRWTSVNRRRRIVAGIVLTLIAILTAFALLWRIS